MPAIILGLTLSLMTSICLAQPIEFRDDMNRVVSLEAPAERIVALSHYAVDPLIEMGVTPVARGDVKFELTEKAEHIHAVSVRHGAGPNIEQVAALEADLIIVSIVHAGFVDSIEKATDVPVAVMDPTSLDDLTAEIRKLGTITGKEKLADSVAVEIESQIESVLANHADCDETVYALFGAPGSFFAFLPNTYLGAMIDDVGGVLVAPGEENKTYRGFSAFSIESALAADPDVILLISHMAPEPQLQMLNSIPGWTSLRAVKEGRVYTLAEHQFVSAPGTDPVGAYEKLISLLEEG
ncbi:MAG: ABC transporter substrate-binding protein [Phycisphaera sp.]|nr:MAG: ABC transporter substrate-binding protein [Phycisphaera sp.]